MLTTSTWILYSFTVLSAAISAGYSIKAWKTAATGVKEFTRYTLVRSKVLLALSVASFAGGKPVVIAAGLSLLLLQVGDAWVGFTKKDAAETYGPLAFAIMSAVLVWWSATS